MDKNKFKELLLNNLDNPKIHDFLIDFIGLGYEYISLDDLDNSISIEYEKIPKEELAKLEKELSDIVKMILKMNKRTLLDTIIKSNGTYKIYEDGVHGDEVPLIIESPEGKILDWDCWDIDTFHQIWEIEFAS